MVWVPYDVNCEYKLRNNFKEKWLYFLMSVLLTYFNA